MKWKSAIELKVPDAFDAIDKLRKAKGVIAVNAVTVEQIRVKYDNRKLTPEKIQQQIK